MDPSYQTLDNKLVYRVCIQRDTNSVVITPLGMECLEFDLEGEYSWGQLPQWMTDKLAVLNTLYVPPPPNEVKGVGQRISPNVFWVYK